MDIPAYTYSKDKQQHETDDVDMLKIYQGRRPACDVFEDIGGNLRLVFYGKTDIRGDTVIIRKEK